MLHGTFAVVIYDEKSAILKDRKQSYPPEALAVWVARIKASGCKRVWAYFNNDREAHAIKNARELTKQLKRVFRG